MIKCSACVAPSENSLVKVMNTALSQINILTNKVSNLESFLKTQNDRLGQLVVNSGNDSCDDPGRGSRSLHGEQKSAVSKKNIIKSRKDRNYRSKRKNTVGDESSLEESESISGNHKRRRQEFETKQQKSRTRLSEDEFSNSSSSSRTRSSSSSSSSSTSSCSSYPGSGKAYSEVRNSRRYRRTIKSGARVKTRPVVRT